MMSENTYCYIPRQSDELKVFVTVKNGVDASLGREVSVELIVIFRDGDGLRLC